MKLIIISGLSGAGKTIALHSLEDMGVYCIDNLPVGLMSSLIEQTKQLSLICECVAVGIDARTIALKDVSVLLETLKNTDIACEVVFIEADDSVLIKRFSETRRKHPLTSLDMPLSEAIERERNLLEPLARWANIRIDTSRTHVHQLRDIIRLRIKSSKTQGLSLLFLSFGFKHGLPTDTDFVFDARCLPNPYWESELRSLTGKDEKVADFLGAQPKVQQMQAQITDFLSTWIPQFSADNRSYLTVAIGCTGGQHRSVYLAEQLYLYFREHFEGVLIRHRELS